jgi:hypothetical protein
MNRSWVTRTAKLARGAPPVLALALVSGAALAGGGPALAAAHTGRPAAQHAAQPAAGDISTVAGGPGGLGLATKVGLPAPVPAPRSPVLAASCSRTTLAAGSG